MRWDWLGSAFGGFNNEGIGLVTKRLHANLILKMEIYFGYLHIYQYSITDIESLTALNMYLVGGLHNTRVLNMIINTITIISSSPPMTPPITAPTRVVPQLTDNQIKLYDSVTKASYTYNAEMSAVVLS